MTSINALVIALIIAVLSIVVIGIGSDRQQKADCLLLQEQAMEFPNEFFQTYSQQQNCKGVGMTINAPVQ